MKKLLLLFALFVSISCSKEEEPKPEPEQDYTSFVISGIISDIFTDAKIGYYDENNECKLLIELGDLIPHEDSKEFIMPEYKESVYLFYRGRSRLADPFTVKKNIKNKFFVAPDAKGIRIDEITIYTWPH